MKAIPQQFEQTPLSQLQPHPKNPRRGDLAAIGQSLAANGWYGALVAQRSTGYILAGNHRYRAAQAAGATELPVLWLDIDDATAQRILLADNRTSDLADQDDTRLAALLASLLAETGTLSGTGYAAADLDRLLAATAADPLAGDQSAELSDIYQILIECRDEAEQTALLTRFQNDGLACRALVG